jgi:fructose-1,6-bisphosphatase/inositol monophosphatase family enzyme
MSTDSLDTQSLVELLQRLGGLLCDWRADPGARRIEDPRAFKTEVDRRAHEFLSRGLERIVPGIPIISEEDAASYGPGIDRESAHWIIDPLDGTASWYGGFAGFVTQVALMQAAKPVVGAIYAPVSGRMWLGSGAGATLNGQPLRRREPAGELVFTDNTPEPHGITQRVMTKLETHRYVESGSLGLKSALVADGTADVFIKDVVVRDWDLAPAAALLEAVGAVLCRLDGTIYSFRGLIEKPGGFFVAAGAATAQRVLAAVP